MLLVKYMMEKHPESIQHPNSSGLYPFEVLLRKEFPPDLDVETLYTLLRPFPGALERTVRGARSSSTTVRDWVSRAWVRAIQPRVPPAILRLLPCSRIRYRAPRDGRRMPRPDPWLEITAASPRSSS